MNSEVKRDASVDFTLFSTASSCSQAIRRCRGPDDEQTLLNETT